MKAEVLSFSMAFGETPHLDELQKLFALAQANPKALLFHCDTRPSYPRGENGDSDHEADGDCYVIIADSLSDAKKAAKPAMGPDMKYRLIPMKSH